MKSSFRIVERLVKCLRVRAFKLDFLIFCPPGTCSYRPTLAHTVFSWRATISFRRGVSINVCVLPPYSCHILLSFRCDIKAILWSGFLFTVGWFSCRQSPETAPQGDNERQGVEREGGNEERSNKDSFLENASGSV